MRFLQELDKAIREDVSFYHQTQKTFSPSFLCFIQEYSHIFIQTTEFHYLLVPIHLVFEFRTHLTNTSCQPIYEDLEHHHYVDPLMKPDFYRFCKIHQVISLFQKIQNIDPSTLSIDAYKEELRHFTPPIFRLWVECVEPSELTQILPLTTGNEAVYTAQLMIQNAQKFPLYIGATSITNWLVQQGCPFSTLERMKYPLRFPIHVHGPDMTLYKIEKDIIEWCFKRHDYYYPFDMSIDQIIMTPSYRDKDHFQYVYSSIRYGHYPTKTGFSVLLKKTDLRGKDLFFLDYIIQQLKNSQLDIETWTETGWQENQDKTIELVFEFGSHEILVFLVLYLCMNMIDVLYVDMDYWVLRLYDRFSYYMKFIHLVRFKTDRHETVRNIDKRIVEYIQNSSTDLVPTPTLSAHCPPFYQHHPQKLVVFFTETETEKIEIPVYLDYLNSGLINRILNPRGFKPTNKDRNIVELHIPDIFRDQEKIMYDWITYSYLQQIPSHCSVEDVLELFHLSQYLQDDPCEKKTEKWLDHRYMTEFETHLSRDHLYGECQLCDFWYRSYG